MTPALAVERYVRLGKGDPETALDNLQVWPWKTEDMLALAEWLREVNTAQPPEYRVRFFSLDIQHTKGVADAVAEYIERVDPEYHATVRQDLGVLVNPGIRLAKPEGRADRIETGDRIVSDLRATLEERRVDYVSTSSKRAWGLV